MPSEQVMQELVRLSRELGEPANDYVILGEGNTSALFEDGTFAVKASGTTLKDIKPEHFVSVYKDKVLAMLQLETATDEDVKNLLQQSRVDQSTDVRPSVETVLHASLLDIQGIRFVGHTHPTAVNSILCSKNWKQVVSGRLFPDEIVCCGIAPVLVDYVDPGLPLAREVHNRVREFCEAIGTPPKAILMQNHGLIAIGATVEEVLSITAMWVKTARVLAGTFIFGGPNYFTDENVMRIHSRPDELYRMQKIRGASA